MWVIPWPCLFTLWLRPFTSGFTKGSSHWTFSIHLELTPSSPVYASYLVSPHIGNGFLIRGWSAGTLIFKRDKAEFDWCYTLYAIRVFTVPYSLLITCFGLLIIFESFSYHCTSGCRVQLFSICILLFSFFYPLVVILCLQVTLFGQSLKLHLPLSPHIFSIYLLAKWVVLSKTMTPEAGSRARKGKRQKMTRHGPRTTYRWRGGKTRHTWL